MPTFPPTATTTIVGPNQTVVLVLGRGVTDPPFQILDDDENGVFEIGIEGKLRTIAGAFWVRGPSITADIDLI